jgi:ATP-dependent Clp protease ATP-binding subunit ClpC
LREVLARRSWDLSERRAAPVRAVKPLPPRSRDWREMGRPMTDMLAAQHDIHELFEQLLAGAQPVRGADAELVRWQLEIDQLARRADSLARHGIERIAVDIAPLQTGAGDAAVQAAWADYAALIAQLDLHELPSPRAGVRCFEGVGLRDAFAGECGIHLWYVGDDRPLPLAVRLWPVEEGERGAEAAPLPPLPTEIVRLRLEPARPGDQRRLSDLRSGRVRKFNGPLSGDDWRLLLWDGRAALAAALAATPS